MRMPDSMGHLVAVGMWWLRRGGVAFIVVCSLVTLSPLLLVIAIAIPIDDWGPVLFCQRRIGQHGRPFGLYKFRKFRADSDCTGLAVTLRDDPRLTRVGWLLERTKLDELPQLWNILCGHMAFVGPRPESLHFAQCFSGSFREVLEHRPGLFGPSQALFRNELAMYPADCDPDLYYRTVLFPRKAQIDLAYYGRRTASGDIKWLLQGLLATFMGIRNVEQSEPQAQTSFGAERWEAVSSIPSQRPIASARDATVLEDACRLAGVLMAPDAVGSAPRWNPVGILLRHAQHALPSAEAGRRDFVSRRLERG